MIAAFYIYRITSFVERKILYLYLYLYIILFLLEVLCLVYKERRVL